MGQLLFVFMCVSIQILHSLTLGSMIVSKSWSVIYTDAFLYDLVRLRSRSELKLKENGFTNHNRFIRIYPKIEQIPQLVRISLTGADIEQPPIGESDVNGFTTSSVRNERGVVTAPSSSSKIGSGDIPLISSAALAARSKVNEIDFCIAPADVSLSRAYDPTGSIQKENVNKIGVELSLTRALNNASNRAVRRILLARSWPSAEALNLSLRRVAVATSKRLEEKKNEKEEKEQESDSVISSSSSAKCPVPRPILNIITRQQRNSPIPKQQRIVPPKARSRTDQEYVADQIKSFRDRYGSLPGYEHAEDYLASILSLATSGRESERAVRVIESNYYDKAYKSVVSVLRTVGVQFVVDEATGRQVIAPKLLDQDICLSMLDKIQMQDERRIQHLLPGERKDAKDAGSFGTSSAVLTEATNSSKENVEDWKNELESTGTIPGKQERRFKFWNRSRNKNEFESYDSDDAGDVKLNADDLGGVLLSASEPTITRQLNVLSNIVQRALLFGGDQELLVLAETLEADKVAFIERWCPQETNSLNNNGEPTKDLNVINTSPGVQYLNSLIQLLRTCYTEGIVMDLTPPLPLTSNYANAYERLVASAVELGSGYMKSFVATSVNLVSSAAGISNKDNTKSKPILPKPRTAKEGIGQFAVWESLARQKQRDKDYSVTAASSSPAHPSDMEGIWDVLDEVGGKTIGSSTVTLLENGHVKVPLPLEGLRWRLDPGPTHLDTLSFQVLSTDGTIIQYRGFIDRGARLEARFSKRPIKVRGSVMFQMRDGAAPIDFYRDMLPINYRQGTTKFVMTKQMSSNYMNQ